MDENDNVKISDFGFATQKNTQRLNKILGTPPYIAPEILSGNVYDGKKSDVFSLGVLLYVLVKGSFPFENAIK